MLSLLLKLVRNYNFASRINQRDTYPSVLKYADTYEVRAFLDFIISSYFTSVVRKDDFTVSRNSDGVITVTVAFVRSDIRTSHTVVLDFKDNQDKAIGKLLALMVQFFLSKSYLLDFHCNFEVLWDNNYRRFTSVNLADLAEPMATCVVAKIDRGESLKPLHVVLDYDVAVTTPLARLSKVISLRDMLPSDYIVTVHKGYSLSLGVHISNFTTQNLDFCSPTLSTPNMLVGTDIV